MWVNHYIVLHVIDVHLETKENHDIPCSRFIFLLFGIILARLTVPKGEPEDFVMG